MDAPFTFKAYASFLLVLHFLMVLSIHMNAKEEDETHQTIVTFVILLFFCYLPLYYKGIAM